MALQGKGIESMQFFITLRPSPELIGKYTALGQVVKGMNILRHLTEGDKIFSIELL
jgi:cyclophilin family peptidyl-prolyl cis-trans isomerase